MRRTLSGQKNEDASHAEVRDAWRLDRTAVAIASLTDKQDEKDYWLSRTPGERLQALEIMRQIVYGYDPSTTRLQRVLEVVELSSR